MVDAAAVVEAGADALGLNFSNRSARKVTAPAASEISAAVAGSLCRIGLFVDQEADAVQRIMDVVELDLLQFHGSESDAFCCSFGLPYMKVHRVRGPVDTDALTTEFPHAAWHMLDAFVAGQPGGTGQSFDWQYWPDSPGVKLVLAGGLDATNVGAAVKTLRPAWVDVAGGVEGPKKGEKDAGRIREFVAAVRQADDLG